MNLVRGDFVNGSAVVYKKEDGALVAGLHLEDGSFRWFYDRELSPFKCDRAILSDGVCLVYINRQGELINPMDFLAADDFSEDRAFATVGMSTYLLDTDGIIIREWDEPYVTSPFKNGSALLQRMTEDGNSAEEALVDKYGNIIAGFAPKRNLQSPLDIMIDEQPDEWYEGIQHLYSGEGFGVRDSAGNE
ncbi:MAG: hypothetical protein AMXMBFR48_18770 [Ignavibacteriales bacterium]